MATLNLSAFFDDLPLLEMTFALSSSIEQKSTIGGDVIVAEHGVRFWYGSATLGTLSHANHEEAMAIIRRLERPGMDFQVSPRHFDGQGRSLTGTGGTLYSVDNGRSVRFAGMNPGKLIRRGTFFSLAYGGRPRLHQTAEEATVNGSGIVGPVEIVPDLENGWTLGDALEFERPICHAIIVPQSVAEVTLRGRASQGIAFRWRQQLL